jgi:hypothetical protein
MGKFPALWLSPRRDHLGLYFRTLPDGYFDNWYVAAFLEAMLQELPGRFVVVWDGGTMWGWLKYDRLCNFAPRDAHELDGRVVAELTAI